MSQTRLSPAVRQTVAERSRHRCGYCLTAEDLAGAYFTVDHIVPESLGGTTVPDNLCLACWGCNLAKHDRIAGVDPATGTLARLFNPNTQLWHEHFAWEANGLLVVGLTPTGRATVGALQLNRAPLVNARRLWVVMGHHPPQD